MLKARVPCSANRKLVRLHLDECIVDIEMARQALAAVPKWFLALDKPFDPASGCNVIHFGAVFALHLNIIA